MKQRFHYLSLCLTLVGMLFTLSACDDDDTEAAPLPTPKVSLERGAVASESFMFRMKSENADLMAYLYRLSEEAAPQAEEILSEGKQVMISPDHATDVEVVGVEPNTAYTVYAVAESKLAAELSAVASLKITTAEKQEPETAKEPKIALQLVAKTATSIRFEMAQENATRMAYMTADAAPDAEAIINKGVEVKIKGKATEVELTDLKTGSIVRIFAAAANDKLASKVAALEVTLPEEEVAQPQIEIRVGEASVNQVVATFTATDADQFAAVCRPSSAEAPALSEILREGEPAEIGAEPVERIFAGLEQATDYTIYAVAMNSAKELYSEVSVIVFSTAVAEPLLSYLDAWKTGFSYRIVTNEGETCYHCYLDGWNYEHMLAQSQQIPGFDVNAFNCNLLVDFGAPVSGKQNITWEAGCEDPARHQKAMIVGGKTYYVLACLYNQDNAEWIGKPQVLKIDEMEPAGQSPEKIYVEPVRIDPEGMVLAMLMDEAKMNFFFYDLYPSEQFNHYMETEGEQWLMDAVYYSGYNAGNSYTDNWGGLKDGTSYTLAITGVDLNGDIFFQYEEFTTPAWTPDVRITMRPYENEAAGQRLHDCLELTIEPLHIKGGMAVEESLLYFDEKATFDATLDMLFGMHDMATIRQTPELMEAFVGTFAGMAYPFSVDEQASLRNKGYCKLLRDQLNSSTEYAAIVITKDQTSGRLIVGEGYASTDRDSSGDAPEAEYQSFLGNWEVTGYRSDWSTRHTYQLRVEQGTINRSFKVYGWTEIEEFKEIPILAEYNPETKRMFFKGEQNCGRIMIRLEDGTEEEMDLMFTALLLDMGEPTIYGDMKNQVMYECQVQGNKLAMFPGSLYIDVKELNVASMLFTAKSAESEYFLLEDSMFEFNIFRPTASAHPVMGERIAPRRVKSVR